MEHYDSADHEHIEIPSRVEILIKCSHVDFTGLVRAKARNDKYQEKACREHLLNSNRRLMKLAEHIVLPRRLYMP